MGSSQHGAYGLDRQSVRRRQAKPDSTPRSGLSTRYPRIELLSGHAVLLPRRQYPDLELSKNSASAFTRPVLPIPCSVLAFRHQVSWSGL